ncbi:protein kinase [bacterium]|nr:MAG: protein kinase [bacterium]
MINVLIRYGFGDVIQGTGLDKVVLDGRRKLRLAKPDLKLSRLPRSVRIRNAMEELGPTFIKLGQILATRPDLIPREWANEFTKLQDDVTAVPGEQIIAIIHDELGEIADEFFEFIDPEPLAAASLAQVHCARLNDGTEVVLKVLRPGIRKILDADLEIMELLAQLINKHTNNIGFDPLDTVEQFRREVTRETDYTLEGRSTDRMRADFENDPNITFPLIYWEATTKNVLCIEQVKGVLLSKSKPSDFTLEERERIVRNGTHAVFRQCLELGFFHADPHPGNIFVLRDEAGIAGKLCFIDCGMTGSIEPAAAEQLADIVQGTVSADLDKVIDVMIAMTYSDPMISSDRAFRSDVWEFISHFQNSNFKTLKMGLLLSEFFEKLQRNKLHCPADIVFLIKAITTIEGVGEALCPEFDVVAEATPSIERLVRRRYSYRAIRSRFQNTMLAYMEMSETLPRETKMLLTAIRRQKITLNLEHRGLQDVTRSVEHASRNISRALIFAALLMSSSMLMLAYKVGDNHQILLAIGAGLGYAAACVLALWTITMGKKR